MEEQTQGKEEQGNKVDRQYKDALKKMVAIMKGPDNMKATKIKSDEVSDIVDSLLKERRESAIADFKKEAISILDKKMEFDKEVKRLEQEFENKVNAKKTEFTNAMQALFKKVESINDIEKSYLDSLNDIGE
jgi:phage host-nuclease inhibitor protein Gam